MMNLIRSKKTSIWEVVLLPIFFLARDRYSYAVMEMQPHIQGAKWHQYEVYRANSFILVIFLVLWKKFGSGQLSNF